ESVAVAVHGRLAKILVEILQFRFPKRVQGAIGDAQLNRERVLIDTNRGESAAVEGRYTDLEEPARHIGLGFEQGLSQVSRAATCAQGGEVGAECPAASGDGMAANAPLRPVNLLAGRRIAFQNRGWNSAQPADVGRNIAG